MGKEGVFEAATPPSCEEEEGGGGVRKRRTFYLRGRPFPFLRHSGGRTPYPLAKKEDFLQRRQAQDFPYFPRQAPPFSKRGFAKKEKDENSFSAMKPGGKELFLFFLGGGGRSAGIGRVKKSFPLR